MYYYTTYLYKTFIHFRKMMHCDPEIGPVRNLQWEKYGFEDFTIVAILTIGDGNCYFHALAHAFYIPYRTQLLQNKTVSRQEIVRNLRNALAIRLGEPTNPLYPTGPTFYTKLSRGEMYKFGEEVPEYSFTEMRKRLRSNDAVGNEYNEFVSDQLKKDVYILDGERQDVYVTGDDDDLLYKNRSSVVLLYLPGHYELIGIQDSEGKIQTYFSAIHPFIQFLRARMIVARSKK